MRSTAYLYSIAILQQSMKVKLNASLVKTLKPANKLYTVRDTEIPGFILRVSPSGGKVYYMDYRASGKRKSYRIGNNLTPAQARDVAKRLSADIAHGKDIQSEKQRRRLEAERAKFNTLGGFLKFKYEPWAITELKWGAGTVDRVRYNFAHLMSKSLSDINAWIMTNWRREQINLGKSKTTVNRDVAALSSVLSKAAQWEILESNPLAKLKPLKVDTKKKVRYLTEDENKRLRSALEARDHHLKAGRSSGNDWRRKRGYKLLPEVPSFGDHLTPMVLLTLNTGLRRGEAFSLTWENINFATKMLTIEGADAKSGHTRHIPLNQKALTILKTWRKQSKAEGLVFPSKDGTRLDNVRKSWAGVLKASGISDFRWHDLRHDFASKLVMKGVPLNTVRELLGHASLDTTLRYAHLAPDHKADAVAMLD